ncbi:MAG: tRNA (guanosine(46)-N7)-methyltransferase TrmB [Rickettsiales bacterium]|nr:tRNA (guanosine(46)-N7)-methyltransferase TrmB [Rickettsiales bacterium]
MPNQPEEETVQPRLIASFGRRRGKTLRVTKQGLMHTLLPQLLITLPEGNINPETIFNASSYRRRPVSTPDMGSGLRRSDTEVERSGGNAPINESHPSDREAAPAGGERSGGASPINEYWLEIGFGGGEHLAHQASLNPHVGLIGCEPYLNGVAGLLKHIDDEHLTNIRIYGDDARLLMAKLPDACLTKAFILYPDPWPKARHKKRRIVNTTLLNELARLIKPGGELRLATDDDDYCTWMLEHTLPHPAFTWQAHEAKDWLTPPSGWITTRYEQKKAIDRGLTPSYLNFIRK